MKNILFFYPNEFYPNAGGVERVSDQLIKSLIRNSYNVYCLHLEKKYNNLNYIYPVKQFFLPSSNLNDEVNIEYYNKILKDYNINTIVNQHGLYEGTYFVNKNIDKNIKIISVLHSNPLQSYDFLFRDLYTLKNNTYKELLKRIARCLLYPKIKYKYFKSLKSHHDFLINHNNIVCVLSESYEKVLYRIDKRYKFYNGICSIPNPNTYNINLNNKDLLKEKIVLFVGRLDNRSKKLFTLISIWAKLEKAVKDWKLVIVGDGPDGKVIKEKANGISSIEFVGYKEPEEYYRKASIYCMTSIFEGFPMSLTEAMQFGCVPVVFDSFPAVYDIIKDGYSGKIIPAFNCRLYQNELLNLIKDNDYRGRMSLKAMDEVSKYNIKNIIEKWIEIINK